MNKQIKILTGQSDSNIEFNDLVYILENFNFEKRIKGSHYIFTRYDIEEIINIQSDTNKKSKPYQVKQVRKLILKYKLGDIENE